jgi:lipopolysaccharide transport system permease protein
MLSLLFSNRHLVWELVTRDVRSRYTGSVLGLFWSVLNPLLQLLLYTVVFSVFLGGKLGEGGGTGHFAASLFCALLPWSAIQESTVRSARGFLDQANLIKKARFPLEVIPFSLVCSALIHQIIATAAFAIILLITGLLDPVSLGLLIPLLIIQAGFMFGSALLIATANVFFKDIAQIIGVVFMFLFWLTPIVYPKSVVPADYVFLLDLNPLTHMVEAFRSATFGTPGFPSWGIVYWVVVSCILWLLGSRLLRRTRSEILDLL